ncbi:MAG: hypothetical protein JXQ80_12200 [Bacteroidales bacterium]|nr:hypothetical protein [Bacteroidales bacterium]
MQINPEAPNRFTYLSAEEKQFIAENWDVMGRTELLNAINQKRARKIGMNKMKCVAFRLGVFKSDSSWFNRGEREFGQGKLTVKDRWFIKKQYRHGTPQETILKLVNMSKDVKVSFRELQHYIDTYVIPIRQTSVPHTFNESELKYISDNVGKISWQAMADELNKTRDRKISGQALSYRVHKGLLNTI